MGWSETIVQKDSYEAEFERMSDEEIIKAIEERANKLGIKVNLRYDRRALTGCQSYREHQVFDSA